MRILILNTYHKSGGAAIAARRLHEALSLAGADALLFTSEGVRHADGRFVEHSRWQRTRSRWLFYAGKLWLTMFKVSKPYRFAYSEWGLGIHGGLKRYRPDVVHLHWINDYFLSTKQIQRLLKQSIPLVWTFHDMWPFTGGCHYSVDCTRYLQGCGGCFMLQKPSDHDASKVLWQQKKTFFSRWQGTAVGCSNWIAELAVSSGMMKPETVKCIPNPLDTQRFRPQNKTPLREARGIDANAFVLFFGAMSLKDRRKGFHLLQASLEHLKKTRPDLNPLLVVVGKAEPQLPTLLPYKVHYGGMVTKEEDMAEWYALSDAMALSSMQDNLPNTVMESMASGVPVVAYAVGGIPEMIQHGVTGMLVTAFDTKAYAEAIAKLMDMDRSTAGKQARDWVTDHYSYSTIAASYMKVYETTIARS